MKKLTICNVTSMHDWNDDRIFERASVGLAAAGHDVYFVAPADQDKIVEGVKIVSIAQRTRLGKHLMGPFDAFRKMRSIKADVYHFYNPNMLLIMGIWAKLSGAKVFVDIHENYESRVDKLPLPGFLRRPLIKFYRWLENTLCGMLSGVTVVTESMRQKMLASGVPILVVDNVPYLKRLEGIELAKEKHIRPTIITSGSHSEARNCLEAVEALPMIVKEIPDVQMMFVGRFTPASYEQVLKDKAKELGVEANFSTEGMLPWLENFKRVSRAHIGCVFYNDNLNNRVTLPNRLYEYMYCGLAVLGENFPEVKKVLDKSNAGAVVDSKNPESIAKASISLLKEASTREQCSANAMYAVKTTYNFERALDELIRFYQKSLA